MPREGTAYHVDADWRRRVELRLAERNMSRAELARVAGCSRSLITELLKNERQQTTYLPEIHAALGWDPPQPPLPSADAGEIAYIFDHLDEAGRAHLIDEGRKALSRILKAASARSSGKKS